MAIAKEAAAESNTSGVIRAQKLTRVYTVGSVQVRGVDNVDLTVARGELVVLKGESGSGKSTLLSLLGGLDRLSSGTLEVAGTDLTGCNESTMTHFRRRSVGMIFQSFNLLPTLTVTENILLPGMLAGKNKTALVSKADELIGWLRLDHRRTHRPHQLSGGEMQRTAIARALINDPDIVLADEPTGNLDSRNAEKVIELLAALNTTRNRTVVIATHSRLADPIAGIKIELQDGRVVR